MSDFGSQITYSQLLERHGRIRIPMIQRDYAQGRPGEHEVREAFLHALETALTKAADDSSLPLNLDFVYGSVEGKTHTRFSPLDGQQRLTTLFLLHWYLAWQDEAWDAFAKLFCGADGHSKFSYGVRPSSNEFFDRLVVFRPAEPPPAGPLVPLVTDQPWYFRNWRLDPTIQSALVMLDAIHRRFAAHHGLFARLTSAAQPAITFQLLDLKNFGLSDDLYIKMNARGKPLTAFETFKARYEQVLAGQFAGQTRSIGGAPLSLKDFVSHRLDTSWADFFWVHRDLKTNLFDEAIMNLFRLLALVSRSPDDASFLEDVRLLRDKSAPPAYSTFQARGWLDEAFTALLISVLETWSATSGLSQPLLPEGFFYFDEKKTFQRLVKSPADLTAAEVVVFSGYVFFIQQHEGKIDPAAFREWVRLVHNLSVNSDIDRDERLLNPLKGLRALLPASDQILARMADFGAQGRVSGFSDQQQREEALKAFLILQHPGWRPLIEQAEQHGYFTGQIEFLLEFSGAAAQWAGVGAPGWDEATHQRLQESFRSYLEKAAMMFGPDGLIDPGAARWERALLTFGDYMLPMGSNYSFLVDSRTEPHSWKRLLRAGRPDSVEAARRPLLRQLWDRLTAGRPAAEQLDEIIAQAAQLSAWREPLVRRPAAVLYCEARAVRWAGETQLYLLRGKQLRRHAELFTLCLWQDLQQPERAAAIQPLTAGGYDERPEDDTPYFPLHFASAGVPLRFQIHHGEDRFAIWINPELLEPVPNLHALLVDQAGFALHEESGWLLKPSTRPEMEQNLLDLAALLQTHGATAPQP